MAKGDRRHSQKMKQRAGKAKKKARIKRAIEAKKTKGK